MSFAAESPAVCALDGIPTVCYTPTSSSSLTSTALAIPLEMVLPQCVEAISTPAASSTGLAPTLSPIPSPTPSPTFSLPPSAPGASGDPHCTNMRGENFEVYKRGKINMVTIPQGRDAAEADFSIVVVVTPTWWKKCAASFISLAIIMRESSCEKITIRPGDGLMPEVEQLPDAERRCNQTSTLEKIGE